MKYQGMERRRHRVFLTRNTEYHVRDGVCIAVRDRMSKRFLEGHIALSLKVAGGVKLHPNGCAVPSLDEPTAGDAIYFNYENRSGEERQIVTSRVESIGRPEKAIVKSYPLRA